MATLSEMRLAQELMTQFQRGNVEDFEKKLADFFYNPEDPDSNALFESIAETVQKTVRNEVGAGRIGLYERAANAGEKIHYDKIARAVRRGFVQGLEEVVAKQKFSGIADLYQELGKDTGKFGTGDFHSLRRAMNDDKKYAYHFIPAEKLGLREPAVLIIDNAAETPLRIAFGGAVRDGEKEKVVKGPMTMFELAGRWNPPTHWNPETRQEEKGEKFDVLTNLLLVLAELKEAYTGVAYKAVYDAHQVCRLATRQKEFYPKR